MLIESEQTWDDARRAVVSETGGHWVASATRDMMGMSAPAWSRYMHDTLGVSLGAADIDQRVVRRVLDAYTRALPVLPGAVSSEEVPRGKPAPDVYLEAARQLDVRADQMAAVEDAANGIRSAVSAGMRVVAIPNREFPPPSSVLCTASIVLPSLGALTGTVFESSAFPRGVHAAGDMRRDPPGAS